ncbi:serine/threonine-protein kinase [Nonomuraea sp. NPDC049158]|uniref:serine/threonine-protein kinase n=1 Tax=Nonomuraea sp. NPDC049158 TaxID=3155649 RepID=UPI003401D025
MSERRSLADGRYVLESEPIGSGGMGTVWRGYDQKLRRTVAVKALHLPAGLSAEEQARLRARAMHEARAIARLEHPGIVGVYDVLEEDGQPWIVMRFISGRPLDQEVKANGPLDPRRAAEIGAQVLDALSAAHDEGVLHLDVKPQNVLLDDHGRAVLTDFGIASVADATATQSASLVGTVGYIAPERLAGSEPGPAADLWSLGATLYFAVEGRPAYAADRRRPSKRSAPASSRTPCGFMTTRMSFACSTRPARTTGTRT